MLSCNRLLAALLLTAAPVGSYLSTSHAVAAEITGAGSSFAAPIYQAWGDKAKSSTGISLNYQSVGSSAGQNLVTAGTVDFGASDAPMAPEKLASASLYQFPTVMGGIVPIVNVPGIASSQLKLSGPVLAEIYLGTISNWNDPKIVALNPGVSLPDLAIAPVHRADGSGTSFVFTSYLTKVSPAWKDAVGAATSVQWPGGAGARGNDGVGASVRATEGGIGYVEYAYARRNGIPTALLQDKAGEFVTPDLASFSAAAAAADWDHASHFAVDLLDGAGKGAWPIMSATFVLVPTAPKDAARGAAVWKFFDYSFRTGDATAKSLDYVALPESVKMKVGAEYPGHK
ncbi:phosphate ABC transporter substrate-binding protein PstS [Acetobacter fallax]|uniref:Phosphate-binding protein PstS n=1 Tax=Acetobacter fallax TaxID=1737473 RepID=A0ABX0K8P1_9PROT|nr:phosphate ABC transporter substrate-binding protein PstS [Acetobacter fallax]NHO31376.1 phosphate ABC transporter substrate-binding protein PstS [Acetobacter fallax]NHO35042.1 phosphate ABC transporter substrate-binding protein PstS [Acetobacter fallax]